MLANHAAAQANVELMRSAFAALSRKDLDACVEFLTPDFIINLARVPYQMRGPHRWRKNTESFFNAFPTVARQ